MLVSGLKNRNFFSVSTAELVILFGMKHFLSGFLIPAW